ncbi:MAG: tyrosine-type recombinase/integrase [Chlorobi bacterium]|nr:tyrosine-type recombinase/integrase [Chlorobiota bacterium]
MGEESQKPIKITMKELVAHFEGFLVECERKQKQTRETYQRALREFIKWFPVDKRFRFTTRDVERYKRYLVEKKGLKSVSVGTYMTALRRFCQYLIDIGVLKVNPSKTVIGGRRPSQHSREFLTSQEVGQLLESIDRSTTQGARDFAIINVMLYCALSEHECLHADVGDLQHRSDGSQVIYVMGKGKNSKDQAVVIPKEARKALDHYLEKRYREEEHNKAAPLFPSLSNRTNGSRMTSRGMREAVNKWLKASGVKRGRDRRLTPFSLRHTAGVMMVDNGATIEEVMQRMRIEWRPTAQIYFKLRGLLGTVAQSPTTSKKKS